MAFPKTSANTLDCQANQRTRATTTRSTTRKPDVNRKPIGLTVPYREVGYKEPSTLAALEKQIKELKQRVEKLEKQVEKKIPT